MSILSKTEIKHKCQESVYSNFSHYACGKNAKHEHEGKWYCGIHNPPTVAAKRKARDDKWMAQMGKDKALTNAKKAVASAESEVLTVIDRDFSDMPLAVQESYVKLRQAREALEALNH